MGDKEATLIGLAGALIGLIIIACLVWTHHITDRYTPPQRTKCVCECPGPQLAESPDG